MAVKPETGGSPCFASGDTEDPPGVDEKPKTVQQLRCDVDLAKPLQGGNPARLHEAAANRVKGNLKKELWPLVQGVRAKNDGAGVCFVLLNADNKARVDAVITKLGAVTWRTHALQGAPQSQSHAGIQLVPLLKKRDGASATGSDCNAALEEVIRTTASLELILAEPLDLSSDEVARKEVSDCLEDAPLPQKVTCNGNSLTSLYLRYGSIDQAAAKIVQDKLSTIGTLRQYSAQEHRQKVTADEGFKLRKTSRADSLIDVRAAMPVLENCLALVKGTANESQAASDVLDIIKKGTSVAFAATKDKDKS